MPTTCFKDRESEPNAKPNIPRPPAVELHSMGAARNERNERLTQTTHAIVHVVITGKRARDFHRSSKQTQSFAALRILG